MVKIGWDCERLHSAAQIARADCLAGSRSLGSQSVEDLQGALECALARAVAACAENYLLATAGLSEQFPRHHEIGRPKAFRESAVDGGDEIIGSLNFVAPDPNAGELQACSQFEGQR